jgi:hypothetical protein
MSFVFLIMFGVHILVCSHGMAVDSFEEASNYGVPAETIMSAEILYVDWRRNAPAFPQFGINQTVWPSWAIDYALW